MAQDYEIDAWLGDDALWTEEQRADLLAQIRASGTDDEDVWIGIVQRHDGATLESLAREAATMKGAAREHRRFVRARVLLELHEDPDVDRGDLARRAGVSRQTIHAWMTAARADEDDE